jgi:hypothetical protein
VEENVILKYMYAKKLYLKIWFKGFILNFKDTTTENRGVEGSANENHHVQSLH